MVRHTIAAIFRLMANPAERKELQLTAALTPESGGYVAQCLEVDVASRTAS